MIIGDDVTVFGNDDTGTEADTRLGLYAALLSATITENIPPYSLAINRPPLTVKEGWVLKKQQKEAQEPINNAFAEAFSKIKL